ncbi:cation:proton antiporter family protein [Gracilimonas mengyeensis]|uniref:Transporter, CPA2 family n=1 Tax=Gracilimonas mengyeensis TaxID=1302730 RepID=A0A521DL07_9BACT|nr:cation:proton antiporter family protein [Gracilimonas mengyeensis]SMO72413.1 transporter, CPA2 family [Gracilimonas mengyeensis]
MEILWLIAAYVLGMAVSKVKVPPLVGFLGAGILLSFFGFEATDTLHQIGHLGVLLLLFTVGLHLRIKSILRLEVLGAGGLHLVVNTGIFMLVASFFGFSWLQALIIGVLLGFSSTVLAAKALESRGELGAFHARVSIGILILQDIVAIVVLALTGGSTPSVWGLILLGLPLLRPLLIRTLIASGHEELQLLYALILAIGGGSLFEVMGFSSELGALAFGALLSGHKLADELSEKLWGLKEAFLVGFFLEVGLYGLPDYEAIVFCLVILALLPLKSALYYYMLTGFKLRARNAFMVMGTLSSYSEFTLIAGVVAVSGGFIPESIVTSFALLVAISYAINAPFTANINAFWDSFEHSALYWERNIKHPGDQVVSLGGAQYLIVGMGQAGSSAYEYLKEREYPVIGLEADPAKLEENRQKKRKVVYGDAQDPELWENINLTKINAIILAIPNHDTKLEATKLIRKYGFTRDVMVLTIREDETIELREAGATSVCLPVSEAGRKLAELSISDHDGKDRPGLSLNLSYES